MASLIVILLDIAMRIGKTRVVVGFSEHKPYLKVHKTDRTNYI